MKNEELQPESGGKNELPKPTDVKPEEKEKSKGMGIIGLVVLIVVFGLIIFMFIKSCMTG